VQEYYALADLIDVFGHRQLWQKVAREQNPHEKRYAARWTAVGQGRAGSHPASRYRMMPATLAQQVLGGGAWSQLAGTQAEPEEAKAPQTHQTHQTRQPPPAAANGPARV